MPEPPRQPGASGPPEATTAEEVGTELIRCRQRGLHNLDIQAGPQKAVETPHLQRLAHDYCRAAGVGLHSRTARISRLLQDALNSYTQRGPQADAQLIIELLFGLPNEHITNAGELLDAALRRRDQKIGWFDHRRRMLFDAFAAYLLTYVATEIGQPSPTGLDSDCTTGEVPSPEGAHLPDDSEVSAAPGHVAVDLAMPVVEPHGGLVVEPARAPTTAGSETVAARVDRRLGWWVLGGVGAAVAVVALVAVVATGALSGMGDVDAAELAPPTGNSEAVSGRTPPTVVPGGRFAETVNTAAGARTYTNPYNLTGEGSRIDNGRVVDVSCVISFASPDAPSVGVHWYQIVSPPWDGRFYSPANVFLNGDPPQGGTTAVDPAVPPCPR